MLIGAVRVGSGNERPTAPSANSTTYLLGMAMRPTTVPAAARSGSSALVRTMVISWDGSQYTRWQMISPTLLRARPLPNASGGVNIPQLQEVKPLSRSSDRWRRATRKKAKEVAKNNKSGGTAAIHIPPLEAVPGTTIYQYPTRRGTRFIILRCYLSSFIWDIPIPYSCGAV